MWEQGERYYRKLNIKKVVIAILILLLLVVSIIVFAISRKTEPIPTQEEVIETTSNTEIFKDANETISIEIPKKYNFKQVHNSEYLIKVSSEDNSDVYVSKMESFPNRPFASVARADKIAYLEEYNVYSNLSELKELSVNGHQAFTYSFHYLDENLYKAFFIQVVLLEMDDGIYIFDIDFPLDELTMYTSLLEEVLQNFTKY